MFAGDEKELTIIFSNKLIGVVLDRFGTDVRINRHNADSFAASVKVLELFDGVLEVKASSGDNRLGGKDFDEALMAHLFRQFQKQHGKDLSQDRYAAVRVREEAEKCKHVLSGADNSSRWTPGGGPATTLQPASCTCWTTPCWRLL